MIYRKFIVWSNIFFIIPLLVSIYLDLRAFTIIIGSVSLFSTYYHISEKKELIVVDRLLASLLILSNIVVAYLGYFRFPYFVIAVILVIPAFYFYLRSMKCNRDYNHGLWHIFSSLITLFCLLTIKQ